ncbi:MAG: hypothetical protein J5712_05955 [Lachnospiraceae bacterium]|nr:hypothetical protein [Lachnospiraceae bacterium]
MNESIRQVLIMTVAGLLFCIAVTILLLEIRALTVMEKAAVVQDQVVWEKGAEDLCGE